MANTTIPHRARRRRAHKNGIDSLPMGLTRRVPAKSPRASVRAAAAGRWFRPGATELFGSRGVVRNHRRYAGAPRGHDQPGRACMVLSPASSPGLFLSEAEDRHVQRLGRTDGVKLPHDVVGDQGLPYADAGGRTGRTICCSKSLGGGVIGPR